MKLLIILTLFYNLDNYEVGEEICTYTNGTVKVTQIKDSNNRCIEKVYSDIKYRKTLYYRTAYACGFCGDYMKLRGRTIEKARREEAKKNN